MLPLVLLDTDAWSWLFVRPIGTRNDVEGWRRALVGRRVVVATQTAAEIRIGVEGSNWGQRRRLAVLDRLTDTPVVPVNDDVVAAFIQLTVECRQAGHALHQTSHTGDRWVAASAIALGASLLAMDGIYQGAPRVDLFDAADSAQDN